MREFEFFEQFLTFQMFRLLEQHPDRCDFEWYKMDGVQIDRHGRTILTQMSKLPINIILTETLKQSITQEDVTDEWFNISTSVFDDFVDVMNEHYATPGIEIGIYNFMKTPTMIHADTGEEIFGIINRIAPVNFYSNVAYRISDEIIVRKPKYFKIK